MIRDWRETATNHRLGTPWGKDNPLELSFEHGGPHLSGAPNTHTCAACRHITGMTWEADGSSHYVNRSGKPSKVTVGLCAHCWGELLHD